MIVAASIYLAYYFFGKKKKNTCGSCNACHCKTKDKSC
ncbi:hypothetical protein [Mergibacter septicus]